MPFKAVFLATAPDADPQEHITKIDTGIYQLTSVVVKNHAQALEVSKMLVETEGVHSIVLCPGHTHRDVAEIQEAVGPNVSVSISRGDAPGGRNAAKAMELAGWFAKR